MNRSLAILAQAIRSRSNQYFKHPPSTSLGGIVIVVLNNVEFIITGVSRILQLLWDLSRCTLPQQIKHDRVGTLLAVHPHHTDTIDTTNNIIDRT